MDPNLTLNAGFSSSSVQTETSSYPYFGLGPLDFSKLNFVKTQQVDYYYDTVGSSSQEILVSQVTQSYDPAVALPEIGGLMIAFLYALGWVIIRIRKMGK
jgi:hypothetical protein